MTDLDRFTEGSPCKVVASCDDCGNEIYGGQEVVKLGTEGIYCNMRCFANGQGAVTIYAGEES